jgi:FecR-like protein/putative zinc finger protein
MKRNATESGDILDRAVSEIRSMSVTAEKEDASLARIKSVLQAGNGNVTPVPVHGTASGKLYLTCCEDFQSLIPHYLSSSLPPTRALLLQDHLMECAVCWNLFEAGSEKSRTAAPGTVRPQVQSVSISRGWKVAAAIAACILVAAVLTQTSVIRNFMWPADVNATVEAANGKVYRITPSTIQQIGRGRQRIQSELVRTGASSRAFLELADGSRIEMNERTELNLGHALDGVMIILRRGNIIVSAAKQHGGHLYVKTADSKVTVVGTVFAVTAGVKGSRVTVIEGKVQVQYATASQPVSAGQQVSTGPSVPVVGAIDEVRWSSELNKYVAMLQKFASDSQTAAQSLQIAGLRYTSNLVPLVAEDTVLVASLPNVYGAIRQSQQMLKARIAENTVLDRWWDRHRNSVDAMVGVVSRVSRYLGPEIIIAAPLDAGAGPLVLANANSPDALVAALRSDPLVAGGQVVGTISGGVMVMSVSAPRIQKVVAYQAQPGTNAFQSMALYQRLAKAYTEGAGWLLAVDLDKITAQDPENPKDLQVIGLQNMQQLVVEQKNAGGSPSFFQTLGFKDARSGMMSWLGAPSTMGALDFISPNAYTAAGVVTKDPNLILNDLFTTLSTLDEGRGLPDIDKFQQENNVDIRRDLAGSLGNEFLVAIDGPVLPSPSWKVVLEVSDPGRLQNALTWSFNELNRRAAAEQKPVWTVSSENRGGLTFYKAALEGTSAEIDYTFLGGYLVIAPNRSLLLDSSRYWATGSSLGRSAEFRQQLPADGRTDFSGFVYHNIKSLTDAVSGGALTGVNIQFPTLICLYGYPDRVVMSSKSVLGTDILSAERLGVLTAGIGGRR